MIPSKSNLYKIVIPKFFFPEDVKSKYENYLRDINYPHRTVEDFATSLIQNINFPSWDREFITQTSGGNFDYPKLSKSAFHPFRNQDKSLNLEMRVVDGFINYFLMFETYLSVNDNLYINEQTRHSHLPEISLSLFDQSKNKIVELVYDKIFFKSISQLTLDYKNPTNANQTFICGLVYESFYINFGYNEKDSIVK